MGMYDTIRCEYPLPEPQYQGLDYQTKSLDCMLWTYRITEDGQLLAPVHREERIPDEEIAAEPWDWYRSWRAEHPFRQVVDRWVPLTDAQTIHFYAHAERMHSKRDNPSEWVEWKAQFVGGRLISIERLVDTPKETA